jgi:phosphoglycerate dehydrogenase-like enzyme
MSIEHTVLVVTREDDPQFSMLKGLRHIVGHDAAAFASAVNEPVVILAWSGPRQLMHDVFTMCHDVRWVHSRSAGLDSLLFPELVASDVPITNGSGVFSQSLGEFALGAILYFAKDFRRMIRNQVAGVWEQFDVEEIAGQTVGIVGYGDIGRAVAKRVHPMGMTVLANKRHPPESPDPMIDQFYKTDDLREMLARCDYVVVSLPLTAETRHMISDAEFAAMKPTAVVINIGRGPVIDQAAMVRALTAGRIKGAGLDVFEQEPIPAGDPMYRLENVLLSPHCADHTADWLNQAMRFFLEQYRRFTNGEPLQNVVNKTLGY